MMIPGCAPVPANGLFEGVPPACAFPEQLKAFFDQGVWMPVPGRPDIKSPFGLGDLGCPGKECHCHLQDEGSPGLGDWSGFFSGLSDLGANAELGFSNVASDLTSGNINRAGSESLAAIGAMLSSVASTLGGAVSGVTGALSGTGQVLSVSSTVWLAGAAVLGVVLFNKHKGRAPRRRKK